MFCQTVIAVLAAFSIFAMSFSALAGQTLTLHGRDDPETLDPSGTNGIVEANIIINLFEGLLRPNPKTLEPEPGMATSWTISPDGKTYTFKLRPGVVWSDGTPLTAHDFAYAWERALRPATASRSAFYFYYIENAEAYNIGKITDPKFLGIRALDARTLQVKLVSPTAFFLKLVSHTSYLPVKKEVVEKYGDKWNLPEHIVSNGPFNLSQWVPQKGITLVKNPRYWDAKKVKLETVRFLPVPDYATALKMYEAGDLDHVFELPPVKVPELKGRPDFIGGPYLNNLFYSLNLTVPPLGDVRVRKALTMAIDRKVITDKILKRGDFPLGTIIPDGMAGYSRPEAIKYDPEKARALLKEAGFGPGGKPFPSLEVLYNTTDEHRMVAETVQNMWKMNLGIEVTLHNVEWKVVQRLQKDHEFQISRVGWVGDYVDPNTFLEIFESNSQMNYGKYKSPAYDKLLLDATAESNNARRMHLLQQAEEMLLKEVIVIPLYASAKNFLLKPYVKGYYPTILDWHPLSRVSVER